MQKMGRKLFVIVLVVMMLSTVCVTAATNYHTVQSGDVLWKIAEKYNTTIEKLVELNNLENPNLITVGQKIIYMEEPTEPEVEMPVVEQMPMPEKMYEVTEEVVTIMKDDMKIIGTLTMPQGMEKSPVVIICHGFTGQRHEMDMAAGGETMFGKTARVLSEQGYATLRIDFIGSGESDGEWADTTVNGQVEDVKAAIDYLMMMDNIDSERIGILGLSQGGMVSALSASRYDEIKAAVIWSAACVPQLEYANLLGMETVLGAVNNENPEAMIEATLPWGATTTLKARFYQDLFSISPTAEITNFDGALQVVSGLQDTIIHPQPNAGQLYIDYHEGVEEFIILDYADHMLDIFTPEAKGLNVSIINAVDFFKANL